MPRPASEKLRQALLRDIFWRTASPVKSIAIRFGLSRQAVHKNLQRLIRDRLVSVERTGHRRRYYLVYAIERRELDLAAAAEDVIWRELKSPLTDLPSETLYICQHGLTEMTNNAIDHSDGSKAIVTVARSSVSVRITVSDNGIGIFQKIATALHLKDPRESLLELTKGKFTTDPARHSGEGIFFTSRVFDRFVIRSSELLFVHNINSDDWLMEDRERKIIGTRITMDLLIPTDRTFQAISLQYSSGPEDYAFSKTHVPIKLAAYGEDGLVSRSSAKRVLSQFEKFQEVMLDFSQVRAVGQAFADEIFRVFAAEHPDVRIIPVNMNEPVTRMVERARAALRDQDKGPTLFD